MWANDAIRTVSASASQAWGAWIPYLLLALALPFAPICRSVETTGRVVGIIDGETLDVLMPSCQVVRVLLTGIDAPKRGQAFGKAAKATLSELVFGRQVVV